MFVCACVPCFSWQHGDDACDLCMGPVPCLFGEHDGSSRSRMRTAEQGVAYCVTVLLPPMIVGKGLEVDQKYACKLTGPQPTWVQSWHLSRTAALHHVAHHASCGRFAADTHARARHVRHPPLPATSRRLSSTWARMQARTRHGNDTGFDWIKCRASHPAQTHGNDVSVTIHTLASRSGNLLLDVRRHQA